MKKENLVSVPFMVLGIVFCVCLVAANLLETKVVQLGPIAVTAGLIVFPVSYIINDCGPACRSIARCPVLGR